MQADTVLRQEYRLELVGVQTISRDITSSAAILVSQNNQGLTKRRFPPTKTLKTLFRLSRVLSDL